MKYKKSSSSGVKNQDMTVVNAVTQCRQESETAQQDRQVLNRENFDAYHLRGDFTHKKKGQSKEFLPKVSIGTEQFCSFLQQGLADLGPNWYTVDLAPGVEEPQISEDTIKLLLSRQLDKADCYTAIGDTIKLGALASLMILKVHGKYVDKPRFTTQKFFDSKGQRKTKLLKSKEKVWQLALDVISPMDYYPDPTGRGLYIIQDIEMDLHEIKAQVKSSSNPNGIYDAEVVDQLSGDCVDMIKDSYKVRETAQDTTMSSYRKRVTVSEYWGTILDEDSNVLHENVVCAVANGKYLIRKPTKNPFWHNMHPFVVAPIVRVPRSVFHKALMDAATRLNRAENEVYNLMLDSGIMSVFGIKQLRPDWLSDPSLIDDGIMPGMTLETNSSCPPGGKVLERVDTAETLQQGIAIYQLTNAELNTSMLTNDLRVGALPDRAVKATEVVESSQDFTGMLNGIAKSIETVFIKEMLEKSWMTIAQHADDFDQEEIKKLLGPQEAAKLASMSPEDRFAETVNGLTFEVFGLTQTLNKQQDFKKLTALLQTLAADPVLMEIFSGQYSMPKFLTEIMKALNIQVGKIKNDPEDMAASQQAMATPGQMGSSGGQAEQGGVQSQQPVNMQSQIAQMTGERQNAPTESAQSIAQPKFPPSRATSGVQ